MAKKKVDKRTYADKIEGVEYVIQNEYAHIHGRSQQIIGHYVRTGRIPVHKEKGSYWIRKDFPCPSNINVGRPKKYT